MSSLERLAHSAQDAVYALASFCCSPSANIKLNGRTFKIVKLLGEGGFSFVYLAQDPSSGRLFALKKIRCPLGSESVREALREVEAYKRFRHPNIIRCLDSCVVQDSDGDGKVIYLFLPYYSRGNLQDAVNAHAVNGGQFAEREMLRLFLGTAKAVQAMHDYHPGATTVYPPSNSSGTLDTDDSGSTMTLAPQQARAPSRDDDEDEEEDGVGDPDSQDRPLMGDLASHAATASEDAPSTPGTGGSSLYTPRAADSRPPASSKKGGKKQPWAHRDLKPANVMIDDEGKPVLMDFGSAVPARIEIPNRSVALQQQDIAAEHSSMPYRAPELFDVKTGVTLTEAVDVWSLGCLLFCLAYGNSPFETPDTVEQGGSMALAAMNGSWRFPSKDRGYSESTRELIKKMLVVDPNKRPDIVEVVAVTEQALERLS